MDIFNGIGDRIFGLVTNEFKENGLKWLARAKYTSMIASPILAGFGGWNAHKEFEKRKKEKNVESLSAVETAQIIVKNEAGAAISMVGGIVASVKSDEIYKQTINALTTAVVLGEDKIKELKKAEQEVVGKEKSEEIQQKANKKGLTEAGIIEDYNASKPYLMRDSFSNAEFWGTIKNFNDAKFNMNYDVINGFSHRLSDFLTDCNIDNFIPEEDGRIGELYGWVPNDSRLGYQNISLNPYLNEKTNEVVLRIEYEESCQPMLIKEFDF